LEERRVTISRAKSTVNYPASFMLVASMNPCPCGYFNHPEKECICAPGVVQKYLSKISGPLLDRIDLHVEVTPVDFNELSSERLSEKSKEIRERVTEARNIQIIRFEDKEEVFCNAQMSPKYGTEYLPHQRLRTNPIKTGHGKTGFICPSVRPDPESFQNDC
jgi:magnesium chelatase family protein